MTPPRGKDTSVLAAILAGPHAVFSPVLAYATHRMGSRPIVTLLAIMSFTALAASVSNPVTVHILRTTPEIAASTRLASNFALFQSAVVTPVGTAASLVVAATIVWFVTLVLGCEVTFPESASIVFIAGVTGVLERLFVAVVLYLRWWVHPSTLSSDISTGLDGLLPPDLVPTFPLSVLRESGLFEIWFSVLVAVGLEYGVQLRRRQAVAVAGATGVSIVGGKVMIAAVMSG